MTSPNKWVDVDRWMAEQSIASAADICGQGGLEVSGSGTNQRIDCPFDCRGDHAGKREIAVDVANAAKQWRCHAYSCQCRGNLLNLMYGWLHGKRWTGDKLRGGEFNEVKQIIAGETAPGQRAPVAERGSAESPAEAKHNRPLAEDDKTRPLVEPPLWEKFVSNPSAMSPAASAYVRRHRCLLSAAMTEKWHVGVLPTDGGGDKRGWSLRNHVIYPFQSEANEVIAFVGRDPEFEKKRQAFESTPAAQRDAGKRPVKYRFPKGFHRGLELFGQQCERLEEPGVRQAMGQYGLVIVEGFNDVIQLDRLGVPAMAICSNQVSDEQVEKIVRLANQWSEGRVRLLLDCDAEGDEGGKEAAWKLLEAGLDVRPLWSRRMHGGAFAGREPESLTREEWSSLVARAATARDDHPPAA